MLAASACWPRASAAARCTRGLASSQAAQALQHPQPVSALLGRTAYLLHGPKLPDRLLAAAGNELPGGQHAHAQVGVRQIADQGLDACRGPVLARRRGAPVLLARVDD